ncbi:uncharacterized protein C20orf204 homolog [Leopardus geoffroyi]|uniref:uncharacterized protein C20orf204 homolog n=1 Tax=Leopardus geoffroyi TaxID=46844 RepID=UPI001E25EB5D|nr:uncharacterized protein C20orf204 homolog [Leopardus geoffroyi]
MVPPKPALWALLLALLGLAPGQAGLRTCSIPDVLRHYRVVIFEDLQAAVRQVGPGSRPLHFIQKNLTGAAVLGWRDRDRVGASCGAQKEHDILLSIASLGRTLRRVVARGHRRGALEKAAWTVALRTEAVMRRHCWMMRQRRRSRWPRRHPPRSRRSHSRRRLLLRVLDTVATCWEKLFALRAAASKDS